MSYFSTSLSRPSKLPGSGSAERYSTPRALANSKMRRLAVGVLAEVDHAVADHRHAGRLDLVLDRLRGRPLPGSMGTWAGYDSQ